MNAIKLFRGMHSETRVRLKVILASDDPAVADQDWESLQSVLKAHEQIEDEFVYGPLQKDFGPGTPLGDWLVQHDADVAIVEQLIAGSAELTPGSPEWKMCIATIMDVLSKHVMVEENQIFGRVEQIWDAARLEQLGAQMQDVVGSFPPKRTTTAKSRPARRRR